VACCSAPSTLVCLGAVSRGWDDVIYREDSAAKPRWPRGRPHIGGVASAPLTGYARRADAELLAEVGPSPAKQPRVYVRGPTPFVEAVAEAVVHLGHEPRGIKTERFGPTGG
jgi:ferredoxin-NADP reductase